MTEKRKDDQDVAKLVLTGTTLRVYRYLYRMGKPCGIREIQRGLGLSSSSVAVYHVKKLLDAGLVREAQEKKPEGSDGETGDAGAELKNGSTPGGYVVDRMIYENMIRIRRSLIPVQVGYSVFFATAIVVLLVLLRPDPISGAYIFALAVIAVACGIFAYQAERATSNTLSSSF